MKDILLFGISTVSVLLVIVVVFAVIRFSSYDNLVLYDNNVACRQTKESGFNKKEVSICYGIYELDIDPKIHYENK